MVFLKLFLNIIIIILAIIAIALVGLRVAGFSPHTVTSNSMLPTYEKYSVIYSKKVKFSDLKVMDVIVFKNSNGTKVTHRIMEINEETKEVITKGDNNEFIDVLPVGEKNIIGKVFFKIPYAEKIMSKIKE